MRGNRGGIAGLITATALALLSGSPLLAQSGLVNPDMEQGTLGGAPTGWMARGSAYDVELVDLGAHGGKQALRIASRQEPAGNDFGNIMQAVDATPYRGKVVRLRGFVRTDRMGAGWTGLWLRVDRTGGAPGFFDNMQGRPITSAQWQRYEIVGPVASDAQKIYVGMLVTGQGRGWLDDVSLEALAPPAPPEGPRALSERGLHNEVAFAKLLGYVRFFHPSDQAAATDWNAFAVQGARAVESASSPRALATVLDSLFRPIAPTLTVWAGPAKAPRTLAAPPTPGLKVVMWRHTGAGLVGASGGGAYHSERVRVPADSRPDSIPSPASPFVAQLAEGVSAAIPLTVYADSAGTRPRVPGWKPADDALPPNVYQAEDRATRLAAVDLAWTTFQHFYPYFDIARTDWNRELPRALTAAATDRDADAFGATLSRLVAALKDGHGNVGWNHVLYGLPVFLGEVEGKVVVLAVGQRVTNLRPGDVVVSIDGRPTSELLAGQEQLISAATPQWLSYKAMRLLLAGPVNSAVTLEIQRAAGPRERVTLTRAARSEQVTEKRPAPIEQLRPGIWYIDMERATEAQLTSSAADLAGARGLVLDMRGYPRGAGFAVLDHLSQTPLHSARWEIPLVTRPDREGLQFLHEGWDRQPALPYFPGKRAFLIDGRAISAAETLMGIVEAYHLGDIVGEPTAGTNGNINPFQVPGGYTLVWTGMKVLKHDGSQHHGIGIRPTVPVSRTVAGIAAGRDEQLERALEIVDGH